MKEIIIIGNKPYKNLDLNSILDDFENNHRCNMGLARKNNGTKYDNLGLCIHLYENLISKKLEPDDFRREYSKDYIEKYIEEFLELFSEKNYNNIYLVDNFKENTERFNQLLYRIGCPFNFSKIPRTGHSIIMENLFSENLIYVSNFSIMEENRVSYYVKKEKYENLNFHSKSEELNILGWLHNNNKIDASFCLLKDSKIPTFDCSIFSPTEESIKKVLKYFNQCRLEKAKGFNPIDGCTQIEEETYVLINKNER
jgi:hypothetical protein